MSFVQRLYWGNLPLRIKNKKGVGIFQSTFLKDFEEPIMLFTGTNRIDFTRFYKDKKFAKKIRKNKIPLNFFLYEPISYYFQDAEYNLGFYSEFHNKFNSDIRLRSEELDCINDLAEYLSIKIIVNLCDWNVPKHFQEIYPYLDLQTRDIFIRQISNLPNSIYEEKKIKKKFWCSNGRYTIHRHIIMCYLSHFEGNYSWFFDAPSDWHNYTDWVENLPYPYLEEGNIKLRKNKFVLDENTDILSFEYLAGFQKPTIDYSNPDDAYYASYKECFCCIINETRFAQPSANFSEKVLDAIKLKRPFILAAPPKTLEYLTKLGFKTFSDWWDESYDQEQNHSVRMMKIFSLINKINSIDLQELEDIHKEMQPIFQHNIKILKKLKKDNTILNAFSD